MNWDDLRFFLAVHRAGTLAGAARALGVEHTTVGRRLTALETALSAKLFARSPDGLTVTAAGREILPLAEQIERAAHAAARRATGEATAIDGVVRLATSEGFSQFLAKRVSGLQDQHPGLLIEIATNNRVVDLSRGEADLAVRMTPPTQPDLVCRKLGVGGWSMYAAASYLARKGAPARVRELAGHDVVGFEASLANTPGAEWLAAHSASARTVMRGSSLISISNAGRSGIGLVLLPCLFAVDQPDLVRVTDEVVGARDIWLVVHPDLVRVGRVRAVMDFLTELAREHATTLSGEPMEGRSNPPTPHGQAGARLNG